MRRALINECQMCLSSADTDFALERFGEQNSKFLILLRYTATIGPFNCFEGKSPGSIKQKDTLPGSVAVRTAI